MKTNKELEEHSQMLGKISMLVEDFANPEDSTITAVLRLIMEYRYMQYELAQIDLEKSMKKDKADEA